MSAVKRCDGPSCRVSNREREAGSGDALFLAWNFSGDCWRSHRATSTERFTAAVADSLFRHDRTTQRQQRRGPACAGSIARRAHRIVREPALKSSCAGEIRSSSGMFGDDGRHDQRRSQSRIAAATIRS